MIDWLVPVHTWRPFHHRLKMTNSGGSIMCYIFLLKFVDCKILCNSILFEKINILVISNTMPTHPTKGNVLGSKFFVVFGFWLCFGFCGLHARTNGSCFFYQFVKFFEGCLNNKNMNNNKKIVWNFRISFKSSIWQT